MSNHTHTPEPWRVNNPNAGPRGFEVAGGHKFLDQVCDRLREENASRIVACVNACVGVSNDALDGGWKAVEISAYAKSLEVQLAAVTAQRDELLKTLKELDATLVKAWDDGHLPHIAISGAQVRAYKAAIAKCEVKNDA